MLSGSTYCPNVTVEKCRIFAELKYLGIRAAEAKDLFSEVPGSFGISTNGVVIGQRA